MYDKKTLVVIIILLIIFLPMAIIGTYRHFTNNEDVVIDDNPDKELIYNNKVYFYYNDELINTYNCSNCSEVVTTIDDTEYHTNYYKYGTDTFGGVINSVIAVFTENDKITFYNYVLNRNINTFDAIKTYNIANNNNYLFVLNNNKWQVFQNSDSGIISALNGSYDYIAIPNHLTDDFILDSSKIIVNNDNVWQVIEVSSNTSLVTANEEIVDFNDYYYITYTDGYHIYNYNGEEIFGNIIKSHIATIDDYTIIVSNNTILIYEATSTTSLNTLTLPNYEEIDFVKSDKGIDIMLDGNLHDTIALD